MMRSPPLKARALSGFTVTSMVSAWHLSAVRSCLVLISLQLRLPMLWHRSQQVQEDYLGNHMTLLLSVCGFPLARFMSRVLFRPTVSFPFIAHAESFSYFL